MEQGPQHSESSREAFRREIAQLKAEETETAHFREIHPEDLTEEDRDIYQAFKSDTLPLETFEQYRARIQEEGSRANFAAYIGNMLMIREYERYLSREEDPEHNDS